MSVSAEFLKDYQDNILYFPVMIPALEEKYRLSACLKYMDHKQVYLLYGKTDDKKYIMKCVDKVSHENLKEEYELQRSLKHRDIASVIEFVEGDKINYLIREYIEGCTITELVEMTQDGHLKETDAVKITIQLCDILNHLHSQSPPIIHRDIKPDNVIYTKEDAVKLIDFGISRRYTVKQEKDTVVMGTEYTAPPEQFGYKQTDARSDIYSIGVLLFYMITGSLNINEISESVISTDLKNIIIKCTEFSPSDRYSTMNQLELKLKRRLDKTAKGRGWIYVSLGAVLTLSVLLLILWKAGEVNNHKPEAIQGQAADNLIDEQGLEADSEIGLSSSALRKEAALSRQTDAEQSDLIHTGSEQLSEEPIAADQITGEPISTEQPTAEEAGDDLSGQEQMPPITFSPEQAVDMQSAADQTAAMQTTAGQASAEQTSTKQAEFEQSAPDQSNNPVTNEQAGAVQPDQNRTVIDQKAPYVFHSPLIEAAVRHELAMTDSEIITLQDLDQIEELYVCGEQIYNAWNDHFVYGKSQYMNIPALIEANIYRNQGSIDSLEDIAQMHNIRTLALYNQKISDLTPLKELEHLSCLGLGTNNISDISLLGSLKTVQLLDISGNPLDDYDMAVLSKLSKLDDLDIGDTAVTGLQKIKQLKLKKLSLFGTKQGDCVGLNEMKGLDTLIISGIGVGITETGMSKVVQLTNLKQLRVMGSQTFDVSIFASMKNLNYLDLCGCNIETIDGLKGLDLQVLYIDEDKVKDFSALEYFPNIEFLGIRNNPCEDYTPLLKLPKLKFVSCNQEQIDKIKAQLKDTPYQFWIQQ